MVTDCAAAYDPGAGENVGAATCDSIVYVALATALLLKPDATAMASSVSVAATVIAPVYFVDEVEGVPFVA